MNFSGKAYAVAKGTNIDCQLFQTEILCHPPCQTFVNITAVLALQCKNFQQQKNCGGITVNEREVKVEFSLNNFTKFG